MGMLQREAELEELVRLVGLDALAAEDRLLMQGAKIIREDFLHQNAYDDRDTYTSMRKQLCMLSAILGYFDAARKAMEQGALFEDLMDLPVLEDLAHAKFIPEDNLQEFKTLEQKIQEAVAAAGAANAS